MHLCEPKECTLHTLASLALNASLLALNALLSFSQPPCAYARYTRTHKNVQPSVSCFMLHSTSLLCYTLLLFYVALLGCSSHTQHTKTDLQMSRWRTSMATGCVYMAAGRVYMAVGVCIWLLGVCIWLLGVCIWLLGVCIWLLGVCIWYTETFITGWPRSQSVLTVEIRKYIFRSKIRTNLKKVRAGKL